MESIGRGGDRQPTKSNLLHLQKFMSTVWTFKKKKSKSSSLLGHIKVHASCDENALQKDQGNERVKLSQNKATRIYKHSLIIISQKYMGTELNYLPTIIN